MMPKLTPWRTPAIPALIAVLLLAPAVAMAQPVNSQAERDQFIQRMSSEHGFDADELRQLLTEAQVREDILEAMRRPAEARPWHEYYPIFLTRDRVRGGVRFWQENAETLERASEAYGVAPEIIVAIIGVETSYGSYTGRYRVLDALATLGFEYPPRAAFFLRELEQFLILARELDMPPQRVRGSYAGAMGMPQFISSSYRHYAVDFNRDGRIDLWNNHADIIGSVANYFSRHGWHDGGTVVIPTRGKLDNPDDFDLRQREPGYTLGELRANGLQTDKDYPDDTPVTVIRLETAEDEYQYWAGLNNFYVITRYNHSKLYGMATYLLSQQIREAVEAQDNAGT